MLSEVFIANGITCVFEKASTIISINVASVLRVEFDTTEFLSPPPQKCGPVKRPMDEISAQPQPELVTNNSTSPSSNKDQIF
jgi:hypothetical protein